MKRYHFYSEATGYFSDRVFGTSDERAVEANTPAGFKAKVGNFDHLSQRVDLATGEVVDYQPSSPGDDFEWNTEARRWFKKPEVIELEQKDAAARLAIESIEAESLRAMREALLQVLPEGETKQRLAEADAAIAAQRGDLIRTASDSIDSLADAVSAP